jgi:curli biogenesis system outer membrane secretion channel CsgG
MKYIHRVVNANTSEVIDNDYTKKELDEVKANQTRIDAEIAEAEAKATAKSAILDRIGLTDDELKTILG